MSSNTLLLPRFGMLATLSLLAAISSSVSAQAPTSITLIPRGSGAVNIADLRVLFGDDVKFQHFDFSSEAPFCLRLSYIHRADGDMVLGQSRLCHTAGEHRLLVAMRRSSADRSNWTLRFALHDRELGMGAHLGFDVGIPGGELAASSSQIPREVSLLEEETTLLQWTFSVRPVSAGRESPTDAPEPPRIGGVNFRSPLTDEHELEIRARAEPNEAGVIGTGPVR